MRYQTGMKLTARLAVKIARNEASAHIAAFDLEQMYGEDAGCAPVEHQGLLIAAQRQLADSLGGPRAGPKRRRQNVVRDVE